MPVIKVIKAGATLWYNNRVGEIFSVADASDMHYEYKKRYIIFKEDAKIIGAKNEEPYRFSG